MGQLRWTESYFDGVSSFFINQMDKVCPIANFLRSVLTDHNIIHRGSAYSLKSNAVYDVIHRILPWTISPLINNGRRDIMFENINNKKTLKYKKPMGIQG